MSTHNPRRIDRRTAEHLLGQAPMGLRNAHPPLAALLTAAAVPGRAGELAREQASVAAFRTAHLHPAPQPRRLSVLKAVVMKVLTVKALAVLGVAAGGGVALAASTGTLPNPLAQPARVTSLGLSTAPAQAEQSREAHNPGSTEASKNAKDAKDSDVSKAPSPSLVGLCHAYSAGNKTEHGKALDNPAFTALTATAGGKDKVDMFCQALLAAPAPPNSNAQPSGKPDKAHTTGAADNGANSQRNPQALAIDPNERHP
ncbi:MAG: hypothetical protein JWP76_585 [Dactylosporangium sp.]|jgi:hypothetical protein|nr:hypothetical protein [Dactylosporangium sp.]